MKIKVHSYNFDKLIEDSFLLLGVLNLNWKIEKVNDSWTSMLGFLEKELLTKNFMELLYDRSDLQIIDTILKQRHIIKGYSIHLITKDGSPCWMKCNISKDGNKIIIVALDVTKDNFTKETLLKVSDITNVAGWSYNPKTEKPYWSHEFCEILEVPYDLEISKDSMKAFIHPYYLEMYENALVNLFEKKIGYNITIKCVTANQKNKWLQIISYPEIVNNEIIYVKGIIKDITEAQLAKIALEQYKETMAMALKGMKSSYFVINTDTNNIIYSESFSSIIGSKGNKITAYFIYKLIHPEDAVMALERHNLAIAKKDNHYFNFFRLKNSDNSYKHYEVYGWKIRDEKGRSVKLIGNLINVNARVTSQKKTKIYIEQIKTIIDNGIMSSILFDAKGIILTANNTVIRAIKYNFGIDITKTPTHFTNVLLFREKEAIIAEFLELKKGQVIEKKLSYIDEAGEIQWFDSVFTSILDDNKKIKGHVLNYYNITKRTLETEELTKTVHKLQKELKELKTRS